MMSSAQRLRVIGGMALGTVVGLLVSRLIFSGGDRLLPSPSGSPQSKAEVRFEPKALPGSLMDWELHPLDDQPTIHAEAIEVATEKITPMAGSPGTPPETLPGTPAATPIDVHNQESDAALRALIDKELASAKAEDRQVWFDVLRGMNEKESREILQLWKMTHGFAGATPGKRSPLVPSPDADEEAMTVSPPNSIPVASLPVDHPETAVEARLRNEPGYRRPDRHRADASGDCPLDLSPGEYQTTGNPFHLAIEGAGFFRLSKGDDIVCTRGGCFDLSEDRYLIQRHGENEWRLEPPVQVPSGAMELIVSEQGTVSCRMESGATADCGRLVVVDCLNPQRLAIADGALLTATDRSGPLHPASSPSTRVRQRVLELSNAR